MADPQETSSDAESGVLVLPVLTIKTTVLFPGIFTPLSVGRPFSVAAVKAALASEEKMIAVIAQRDSAVEKPQPSDLYAIGTRAIIKKMAPSTGGGVEVLVHGIERVSVLGFESTEPYLRARVRALPIPEDSGTEAEALGRAVAEVAERVVAILQPQVQENLRGMLARATDPMALAYLLASMLSLDAAKEQALLEAPTRIELLRAIHAHLTREVQVLELREKIASEAQTAMTKQQREYMLRQQLRAIQEELGEKSPEQAEVAALRQRLLEADLPDEVRKEAERELTRLERLPSAAPDFQVTRAYLDLILELPWRKSTPDSIDLEKARQVLDEDHYDLEAIKDRILEHLAVMKLNPGAQAPILCFVGPPGVGKTSLGQSIGRALGRKFERMSLGGLHDEAELRGHRRTYIGAMPGRILQAIRRAGVMNPLLMLDEVDKVGRDFRGDPAAALLEILDPAQNSTFRDNYLDLPFDLSRVFFITTANSLDTVPRPLLDRMEVLQLSGYSLEEKMAIARRFLIPRRLAQAGISAGNLEILDDTLKNLISLYTREAGVRQLERAIGALARKVARKVAAGEEQKITARPEDLAEMLGPERFLEEHARQKAEPGVATGLAWTETGGEVLYVEATLLPDGRGLRLTGSLGDVMRESAKAAQSFVWSHARELGIEPAIFTGSAVHVHVPAGAVPKDGPSAGVALVTAIASVYSGIPVTMDTAMTGEITLSGLVLPVGGIKEKVLGARRAGLRRVILPKGNEKDLRELPAEVRREMTFVLVERIEEVLEAALRRETATRRLFPATEPRRRRTGPAS
jgi:ATP-dependent Lon protease